MGNWSNFGPGRRVVGGAGLIRKAIEGLISANAGDAYEFPFKVGDVEHSLVILFPEDSSQVKVQLTREKKVIAEKGFPGIGFNVYFDYTAEDRGYVKKVYDAFVAAYPDLDLVFDSFVDEEGNEYKAGFYVEEGTLYVWAEGMGYRKDMPILKRFGGGAFAGWRQDLANAMAILMQMRNRFSR